MSEWISKELSQIAKITKGQQLNKTCLFSHGDYYVLNGGVEPSGYYDKWNTEANTISISEGGNSCGYVNYNSERFWSGGHCYSLSKINDISTECLFHILKYRQSDIMALRVGSGLPNIQRKALSSFELFFPLDAHEQDEITRVLSKIDTVICKTKAIIDKYKALKEGLMQDFLANGIDENGVIRSPKTHEYKDSPLGKIPVEWDCIQLGEMTKIITKLAGFEYSKYFNSYNDGGEIVVIRGTNITHNELTLDDVKYIPRATSNFLSRSKLNKNDIVFAYVGTIGPVWLVDTNDSYHLGPNTARIVLKESIDVKYIYQYFKSFRIKQEITEQMSVGAQPSLSMQKIRKFRILLPKDPIEQKKIAERLDSIEKVIMQERETLNKLLSLKKGLMQDLLTHQVSVEPLLERSVENE